MKKFLSALTALLCLSAVFTGCGKDSSKDAASDKKSGKSVEEELKDVVEDLVDAATDKDIEKIVNYMMPDDLSKDIMDIFGDDLNALIEEEDIDVSEATPDAEIVSVKKTKDMDEDYIYILEKVFSLAESVTDYMKENDMTIDDLYEMDDEEIMETPFGELIDLIEDSGADFESAEELADSGILDVIKTTVTIEDFCLAEVTMKADGEEDSMELPFYNIKGEGWNCEMILYPSMLGYVKKSKDTAANSTARSLYNAANAALTEMDEEGCDLSGYFIICSDESLNYMGSSVFNTDHFLDATEAYFEDINEFDYFMVLENGWCSYIACQEKNSDSPVGTYPSEEIPSSFDNDYLETEYMDEDAEYTLDELYDITKELIG
mgnify:CR=1 FL=1